MLGGDGENLLDVGRDSAHSQHRELPAGGVDEDVQAFVTFAAAAAASSFSVVGKGRNEDQSQKYPLELGLYRQHWREFSP